MNKMEKTWKRNRKMRMMKKISRVMRKKKDSLYLMTTSQ